MSEEEKKAIDDLFALTHINGYIDLYTQKEAKIHTLDLSKWQNGVKVLLNLIDNKQKEIEKYKKIRNMLEETQMKLFEERKEMEKYKRYFKLAVSDLQSEGYMQMSYKDIEKYYSKREDIV